MYATEYISLIIYVFTIYFLLRYINTLLLNPNSY